MAEDTGTQRKNGSRQSRRKRKGEDVGLKTLSFDSVGPRKYALQVRKASNGNPYLKLVEGQPQDDGGFRKFHITVWSEDFERLWAMLDEAREFIRENDVKTPEGHKYVPGKSRKKASPASS